MSNFVLTAQVTLQAPTNTRRVLNQIQSQLQNVNVAVNLSANPSQFRNVNSQINTLNQNARTANASVSELGRTIGAAARRFGAISLATGTFLSLTRSIKNSISDAIEFERQMTVLAQTTEKSVKELKGLYNEVTRLSTGLGVSSDGLIKTSIILAQAGLDARKTKAALEVLAKTQLAASFDDIGSTTEGAIAILAQFRKEAASAGGDIKFLEQSLESINQISKKYAVESADLISVIRRSGGAFEAAGGSLNELLALFTSVRATTRESAETISTGLRTIFTRIQRVDTIKQLKELGIVLQDTEGKFIGPFEAIKRISEGLSSLDPRDFRFAQIVEELGGFRQIGKVIPLIKQFSLAQEALNTAQESSGSLTRDTETAQTALANKISKVKEEFQALVREFTDSESFRSVANGALEFAKALIRIADAIQPLIPLIASLAAVNIGRGLASAIGSFSGFTRRNNGGRILGFATGGMVPGSGNGDTVPAMLSPGEFVIRKSSVKKIGTDNLQRLNKGGSVGRGRLADTREVSALVLAPESKIPRKEQEFTISKKELSIAEKYPGYEDPGRTKKFQSYDEKALGKYKFFRTGIEESKDIKSKIDHGVVEGLKNAINIASSGVASLLGLKNPDFDKSLNFSKMVNPGAKATIFEEMITHLARNNEGDPFDKKNDPNAPFDFIGNIGKVASIFGSQKAASVKYKDAKNSVKEAGLSGFESKTKRQLESESIFEATSKKKQLDNIRKFKKQIKGQTFSSATVLRAEIKQRGLANTAVAGARIDDWLLENDLSPEVIPHKIGDGREYRFAKGGVAPSDTVPALLTPGEFVVNKSSAKRIGYGELNRMNKTGEVRGYAQGGTVANQYSAFAPYIGGAAAGPAPATAPNPGQATSNAREVLQSAQNFIFLSGATTTLVAQFSGLSDASKQAVTETLALGATMAGVVGTAGDFALSLAEMARNTAGSSGGLLGLATAFGGVPLAITAVLGSLALLVVYSKNLSKAKSEEAKKRADTIASEIEQGKKGLESRQKYIEEEVKSASALVDSYYFSSIAIQDEIKARKSSAEAYIDLLLATKDLDETFKSLDADKSLSPLEKSSRKISVQLDTFSKVIESAQKASENSSKIRQDNNMIGKSGADVSKALSGYSIGQTFDQSQATIKGASESFSAGFSTTLAELQSLFEEGVKRTNFSSGKGADPFADILAQNSIFASDLEDSRKKIKESSEAMARIMLENGATQEEAAQFLTRTNKAFANFESSAKKQAIAAEAAARSAALLNEAIRNSAQSAFVIGELSSALSRVASSAKDFGNTLSGIQSTLNAELSSFSLDKIEGLDNLGSVVDFDKFESDVNKLSSNFGIFGDSIAKEVIGVAGVFKNSKSLLGREFIGIGDEAGSEAKNSIEQALLPLKDLGGAFESLRNRATAELTKAASPKSDSGAVISAAELENSLSPLKDFSEKNINLLKSLNDTQASLVDQYSAHSKALVDIFQAEASLREKAVKVESTGAQRMAQATGKDLTLQQKDSFRNKATQARLDVAGVGAKAGDVAGLSASLLDTQKNLQANKQNREAIKNNVKSVRDSINEERSLITKLKETKSALESLTDQSEKAADIMSEIEKERGKREFGMKTLENLVSGSAQDRSDIMKSFSGLSVASATGTLQGLDPETRKATFSLLEQLSSVDKRFEQLKKNLVVSDAIRMGVDPNTAMAMATATPLEQKLQQDLISITNSEVQAVKALTQANDELKTALQSNTLGVSTAIDELPGKIEATLNKAFADFKQQQIDQEKENQKLRNSDADAAAELKRKQDLQAEEDKKGTKQINTESLNTATLIAEDIRIKNEADQKEIDQKNRAAELEQGRNRARSMAGFATGGPVYAQNGAYMKPKGTDTVPAMLTPGEFVMKKSSVDKYGTDMMHSINSGKYLANGGMAKKITLNAYGRIEKKAPPNIIYEGMAKKGTPTTKPIQLPKGSDDYVKEARRMMSENAYKNEEEANRIKDEYAQADYFSEQRKEPEEMRPSRRLDNDNWATMRGMMTSGQLGSHFQQIENDEDLKSRAEDLEAWKASRAKNDADFEARQAAPREYITKYNAKNKGLTPTWAKDSPTVDMRTEDEKREALALRRKSKNPTSGGRVSGLSEASQKAMEAGKQEMLKNPPPRKGLIGGMRPESYTKMEEFNKSQESLVGPAAPPKPKTYTPEQREASAARQNQVNERLKVLQSQQRGVPARSYQDPINSVLGGLVPQQNGQNMGAGNNSMVGPQSPKEARLEKRNQVNERLKVLQNQQRGIPNPMSPALGGLGPQQNNQNMGAGNVYPNLQQPNMQQQNQGFGGGQMPNFEAVMTGFKDFSTQMSTIADKLSGLTVEHTHNFNGEITVASAAVAAAVKKAVEEYVSAEITRILEAKDQGIKTPI